ncbi:MAG TPA: hypothetical protein VG713_15290, partial [Pirellulales bacterium]|nr:hypothetical protein [Pirellulales bacterium]
MSRCLGGPLVVLAVAAGLLVQTPARAFSADIDPTVLAAEQARIDTIARASAAAITVLADGGRDGGSGVIISADGYAISNFHVTSVAGV